MFNFSSLTPHGFCLAWQPGLIWLTAGSDLIVAIAYFSIPATFLTMLIKRQNLPYKATIGLFAAFILACGTTHLFSIATLWVPVYWSSGIASAVTAVLSIITAVLLWSGIPRMLAMERDLEAAQAEAESSRMQLEVLASQDGLTGLANRRHLDVMLEGEFRRSMRAHGAIAVIMIDVDHFKAFNDLYGHLEGDSCLKAVADTISSHMRRPGDLVARYGGEEMVALMPATDQVAAMFMAAGIVQAVRDLAIPHANSSEGVVTVSAGVAGMIPTMGVDSPLTLLKRADQALYEAKNSGRNQACGWHANSGDGPAALASRGILDRGEVVALPQANGAAAAPQ